MTGSGGSIDSDPVGPGTNEPVDFEMGRESGPGVDASVPSAWAERGQEAWAKELGVPLLELHDVLPSTNRRLRELAEAGAPPFTTVISDAQSRGRGREGKGWHSPSGTGLWMSVLLPLPRWGSGALLPFAVGVALAHMVEALVDRRAGLKWPNDVIVEGRKVAGILCESAGEAAGGPPAGVAVGVGLNLRAPADGFPPELRGIAGTLEMWSNRPFMEPDVARALLDEIRHWGHPAPSELSGRLRREWESRDLLRNRAVRVESGEEGTARGVSPEGALRVALPGGRLRSVRSGSVRLIGSRGPPVLTRASSGPVSVEDE